MTQPRLVSWPIAMKNTLCRANALASGPEATSCPRELGIADADTPRFAAGVREDRDNVPGV